jgi:eukaryotic-like serine/threonine-protein kinase
VVDGGGIQSQTRIPFGEEHIVDLGQPVLAFSRPYATAYTALHTQFADVPLLAYVCEELPGPRVDSARRVREIERAGMLRLFHHGPLRVPGQRDRYAFVFERPMMGPPPRQLWGHYPVQTLIKNFLKPAIAALQSLADAHEGHGSIRPDNLFGQDSRYSLLALGPCTLCPPGFDQPAAFEPIQRALANPISKGPVAPADDMFALGVTFYCLAAGRLPGEGMDPSDFTRRRLEFGSIASMVDMGAMPMEIKDAVEGLLQDDVKLRWNIQTLSEWCMGRKPEVKNVRSLGKRQMSIRVGPVTCYGPKEAAFAMHANQAEAMAIVRSGELDKWLVANDPKRAAAAAGKELAQVATTKSAGEAPAPSREDDDVALAKAIIRCDPSGPIRYKSLSFYPSGAGALLRQIAGDNARWAEFGEALRGKLVSHWLRSAGEFGLVDIAAKKLEEIERAYERSGDNLEAALYKLNPDAPCLSPKLDGKWTLSHLELVKPIEDACADPARPQLDRHMVGFLGAKAEIPDDVLAPWYDLATADKNGAPKVLKVSNRLQAEAGTTALPKLAQICLRNAEKLIEEINHPKTRERLREEALAHAKSGSITSMVDVVLDEETIAKDKRDFAEAKREFESIRTALANRDGLLIYARLIGRERGTAVSYMALSLASSLGFLAMLFAMLGR